MSWSFSAIGTPEKIVEALETESGRLTGESKVEFDAAKPHLAALLRENRSEGATPVVLNLSASGHGSGEKYRNCSVKIEQCHTKLLV